MCYIALSFIFLALLLFLYFCLIVTKFVCFPDSLFDCFACFSISLFSICQVLRFYVQFVLLSRRGIPCVINIFVFIKGKSWI